MSGFFQMRLSKSSWHFKPPGTEYQQWGTGIFKFNEAQTCQTQGALGDIRATGVFVGFEIASACDV